MSQVIHAPNPGTKSFKMLAHEWSASYQFALGESPLFLMVCFWSSFGMPTQFAFHLLRYSSFCRQPIRILD
ncbi:hypothetical protein BDR07DRAFT_1391691 [Suillus spraguei]|nr:hypothetical protein BDR07DRAFT_1391691 [Suillus spraguei]